MRSTTTRGLCVPERLWYDVRWSRARAEASDTSGQREVVERAPAGAKARTPPASAESPGYDHRLPRLERHLDVRETVDVFAFTISRSSVAIT
ncbi:hypothetical protein MTO96_036304 [Rhipicephalus appendiculatus]